MKKLQCEMCGSTDMIKQDGVYVCQSCGIKYTLEEARKLLIDGVVEVTGSVGIDKSAEKEKWLQLARRAKDSNDVEQGFKYYSLIYEQEPNNWEAWFYKIFFNLFRDRPQLDNLSTFRREIKYILEIINKFELNQVQRAYLDILKALHYAKGKLTYPESELEKVDEELNNHNYPGKRDYDILLFRIYSDFIYQCNTEITTKLKNEFIIVVNDALSITTEYVILFDSKYYFAPCVGLEKERALIKDLLDFVEFLKQNKIDYDKSRFYSHSDILEGAEKARCEILELYKKYKSLNPSNEYELEEINRDFKQKLQPLIYQICRSDHSFKLDSLVKIEYHTLKSDTNVVEHKDGQSDGGDNEQYSGSEEELPYKGCLNDILLFFGIFGGIGGLLGTLMLVLQGNMGDILGCFAVSAIGLLALWWLHKRDNRILSNLIRVILSDIFKS